MLLVYSLFFGEAVGWGYGVRWEMICVGSLDFYKVMLCILEEKIGIIFNLFLRCVFFFIWVRIVLEVVIFVLKLSYKIVEIRGLIFLEYGGVVFFVFWGL